MALLYGSGDWPLASRWSSHKPARRLTSKERDACSKSWLHLIHSSVAEPAFQLATQPIAGRGSRRNGRFGQLWALAGSYLVVMSD